MLQQKQVTSIHLINGFELYNLHVHSAAVGALGAQHKKSFASLTSRTPLIDSPAEGTDRTVQLRNNAAAAALQPPQGLGTQPPGVAAFKHPVDLVQQGLFVARQPPLHRQVVRGVVGEEQAVLQF